MTNYGPVTKLAFDALANYEILMEKYSSPLDVLKYLLDGNNFKSLSSLLKETMNTVGLCPPNANESDYIKVLTSLMQKQTEDCHIPLDDAISNKTIRRWLNGETLSIRSREDAIRVCFALSLSYEQATEFLNKAGHNSFNFRNVRDAVYIYCLLNNKPLSKARELIFRFWKDSALPTPEVPELKAGNNGKSTTVILRDELLANSSWETEDKFYNTFLIPNKDKFTGYRKSTLKEYYWLKNSTYISVLIQMASDEKSEVFNRLENKNNDDYKARDYLLPISLSFRSALRKHIDGPAFLPQLNNMLREDMTNTVDVMEALNAEIQGCKEREEFDYQLLISNLLNDVIKMEGFLKYAISSIKSTSNSEGSTARIRKYSDSVLSNSVMKEFPNDKTFAKYEKEPWSATSNMSFRKAIVLFYYIAYAYDMSRDLKIEDAVIFKDHQFLGFEDFIDQLNQVLDHCGFSPLYPANQFDWLILRSIRQFECYEDEDEESPTDFFNDVLSFSFEYASDEG